MVPPTRIRRWNELDVRPDGKFVLYWMVATRRTTWNFALDRAVDLARELRAPLLILEPLGCDYPWASDRIHQFVVDGMRDNARALDGTGVGYYPYVEPGVGVGRGLLAELAGHACAVVTDETPVRFVARMVESAATHVPVRMEAVDSCGLWPLLATDRVFHRAFDFRRMLQRALAEHLGRMPRARPLARVALRPFRRLPAGVATRWPCARRRWLEADDRRVEHLAIDHTVAPAGLEGGPRAGERRWRGFRRHRLDRYPDDRNRPDVDGSSGLSPYLHFGHLSVHQMLADVGRREGWTPDQVGGPCDGGREGWWRMRPAAEAFLDQLVTWRELGGNGALHRPDNERYESLPRWARATLEAHASDARPHHYSRQQFEAASTHDDLWNAAQRQLRQQGIIHNYLRMLWGKKILHWSRDPREALETMVALNDRYALDGRDPNSYSGIFWVLGRYDRAWGPERPVFGTIRYMSSRATRRKMRVSDFIARWGDARANGRG